MPGALLQVEAVDACYGRGRVLQGVSLEVGDGTVVALLGRNGAGKSTTLKAIMGIVAAARGRIRFDGAAIERLPPHRIARRGIAYVPEDRGIFASLTVDEHLRLNRRWGAGRPVPVEALYERFPLLAERRGIAYVPEDRGIFASLTVDEHLRLNRRWGAGRPVPVEALYERFPLLAERRRHRGDELSGGEQQMLAIARALSFAPRLLILDEPTEGLAPIVVERIAAILHALRAAGMTMLLVEQRYPFAVGLADRVYVLGKGRVRWQGTAADLDRSPEVRSTWLGV